MLAARSSAGIGRKSELLVGVQKQDCKSLHFASLRMFGLEAKSRYLDPIRWRYQATTVLSICSPYLTGRRKSMQLASAKIPHRYRHVAQSEPETKTSLPVLQVEIGGLSGVRQEGSSQKSGRRVCTQGCGAVRWSARG